MNKKVSDIDSDERSRYRINNIVSMYIACFNNFFLSIFNWHLILYTLYKNYAVEYRIVCEHPVVEQDIYNEVRNISHLN
jgi:hypothetical protein